MKIIVIGGGFGGLRLARRLSNKPGVDILLLDKYNYHQFQPLLYQVATASLDASNISFPFRKVFQKSKNVRFRMAEVKEVMTADNLLITDIGEFSYDILVFATGATNNFFGNKGVMDNAFPMKSTVEALELRHKLLQNLEDALTAKDDKELERLLTVIIVGAGPTGVELSGAIADLRRFVLPKDYPEIDFSKMKIYLLEGGPKTLGVMSESSSKDSYEYLHKLNVTVKTNTILQSYDGATAIMQDGETIESALLIWAAGVRGSVPEGIDASLIAKGNRLKVDRYNKVMESNNIYAIGDVAYMESELYPHGHPQLASVAIQQATLLADNLIASINNNGSLKSFEYKDKGVMATVGRNLAVVDIPKPKLHFHGFFAWLIWMGLHLFLILGVKNRFEVFSNWIYNYITYDQNLRLIFKVFYKPKK